MFPYECSVVFKVRKYENWIIADPMTISELRGYKLSKNQMRQANNNNADNVIDAVTYLSQAKGCSFNKVRDIQSIVPKLNGNEMEKIHVLFVN
ncbi:MAG: hypothetical protein KAX49_11425 [Halanaerobiales bacterium]|nr:hypothetical protein [Halanaerobiales bacterium]